MKIILKIYMIFFLLFSNHLKASYFLEPSEEISTDAKYKNYKELLTPILFTDHYFRHSLALSPDELRIFIITVSAWSSA